MHGQQNIKIYMYVCMYVCMYVSVYIDIHVYSRRSSYIPLSVVRVMRCEVQVSSLCMTYIPQE